ncbi:hypothetical protein ACFLSQ_03900 [Bacteroidota bacterium]
MKLFIFLFFCLLTTNDIGDLVVSDIRGNLYYYKDIKEFELIIFKNYSACHLCFWKIKRTLEKFRIDEYCFISRTSDNIISKKIVIEYIESIFDTSIIYFDTLDEVTVLSHEGYHGGYFGKYKIRKTPAILIIQKNKVFFYGYDDLFTNANKVDSIFTNADHVDSIFNKHFR